MFKLIIATLVLFGVSAHAEDPCLNDYLNKGMVQGAVQNAVNCYKAELSNKQVREIESDYRNQLAYLYFFSSEEVASKDDRKRLQEMAKAQSEASVALFGEYLNEDNYLALPSESRLVLSRALYIDGVLLARISEEKGGLTVINAWPKIQKIMKMVMKLGHNYVEYYGAYRTLAIAHTRMPSFIADRQLAFNYYTAIIDNTDVGNGRSAFVTNNLYFAELLFKLNKDADACTQLNLAATAAQADVEASAPGHVHESLKSIKEANRIFADKCN